eukprot:GHVU01006310.1.p1 GENE.GHVU01006310.1~~GHVU01006310.1.p1  ORF type:complete len:100 (-),score=8.50 GHVU01006310.1:585-884(-)
MDELVEAALAQLRPPPPTYVIKRNRPEGGNRQQRQQAEFPLKLEAKRTVAGHSAGGARAPPGSATTSATITRAAMTSHPTPATTLLTAGLRERVVCRTK